MKQEDLYDILINIDEKYIEEAENNHLINLAEKSHNTSLTILNSSKEKTGCFRYRMVYITIAVVVVFAAVFAIFSTAGRSIYANSGKEFKNFILAAIEPRETDYYELSPEEAAEIQRRLNNMDYRFAVPKGYGSIETLSYVYLSEINGYENKNEWLALSVEERNAISQIPEDMLKTMPTDALIITCMNYNFLGDIGLIESKTDILDTMKQQYNGLVELSQRPDAGTELLRLLKAFEAKSFSENDRIPSIRFSFLMMILGDKKILDSLTCEQAREWISQLNRLGGEIDKEEISSLSEVSVFLPILRCLYYNDTGARKAIRSDRSLKEFVVNSGSFSGVNHFTDVATGKLWKIIKENYYDVS